jgi:hypothetical protein
MDGATGWYEGARALGYWVLLSAAYDLARLDVLAARVEAENLANARWGWLLFVARAAFGAFIGTAGWVGLGWGCSPYREGHWTSLFIVVLVMALAGVRRGYQVPADEVHATWDRWTRWRRP